jgi:hypothetical protein
MFHSKNVRNNYKKQGEAEDFFQLQCQTPKLLQDEVAGGIQQENSTIATKGFNRNEILYRNVNSCLHT